MTYYNSSYGYQPNYGMQYPYGAQQFLQGQEWLIIQYIPLILSKLTRSRIPGMIRPYYVHTPTCYVYEYPVVTGMPLGMYSMANGILNLNSTAGFNSNFFGNSGFGAGYISRPVETPYSAAALALQGGKYPVTTMAVPNEMAYPAIPYYGVSDYNNGFGMRYGMYGQRGSLI